jgi:hypothetical protein
MHLMKPSSSSRVPGGPWHSVFTLHALMAPLLLALARVHVLGHQIGFGMHISTLHLSWLKPCW